MAVEPRREGLYSLLLEQILNGELAPGARINASALARVLNASRTPIHEALLQLAEGGFVRQELNRGFVVVPLQRDEVQQRYPIIWTLEVLALHSSGSLLALAGTELRRINERLSRAADQPQKARNLDQQFHAHLVARCTNMRLLELLGVEHRAIERYERLYMQRTDLIAHSVAQHEEIIMAIEQGENERAARALEQNWRFGMERVLLQLQSKE